MGGFDSRRDFLARLQRRLEKSVTEFLKEETGVDPFMTMKISEPGSDHYQQSWRYWQNETPRIDLKVTVAD